MSSENRPASGSFPQEIKRGLGIEAYQWTNRFSDQEFFGEARGPNTVIRRKGYALLAGFLEFASPASNRVFRDMVGRRLQQLAGGEVDRRYNYLSIIPQPLSTAASADVLTFLALVGGTTVGLSHSRSLITLGFAVAAKLVVNLLSHSVLDGIQEQFANGQNENNI